MNSMGARVTVTFFVLNTLLLALVPYALAQAFPCRLAVPSMLMAAASAS